jgi:hypothetical protein
MDEGVDGGLEFVHAAVESAVDLLLSEQREPAVRPGSATWFSQEALVGVRWR